MALDLPLSLAKSAALWVGSISWHLWRIATLRPAFSQLRNSWFSLLSFTLVFALAGSLRWVTAAPTTYPLQPTLHGLALHWLLLFGLIGWFGKHKNLVAACLGASAVIDGLAMGLFAAGVLEIKLAANVLEVLLVAITVHRFFQFEREGCSEVKLLPK